MGVPLPRGSHILSPLPGQFWVGHKMQPSGQGAKAEWQEKLKSGWPLAYPHTLAIQSKADAGQST